MAIGNPIELSPNVATKNISSIATAAQTEFTVTGGYRINEIAVYRNGVRLVDGRDFSATDGTTVTLISDTVVADDIIEFSVLDSFDVAGVIVSASSTQAVNGNLHVTGELYAGTFNPTNMNVSGVGTIGIGSFTDINVSGGATVNGTLVAGSFSGDGSSLTGVGETVNVRTNTITVSGVSTFTGAVDSNATTDSTSSTTGAITAAGGVGIAKDLFVGDAIDVTKDLKVGAAATITGALTGSTGTFSGEFKVGSGITMAATAGIITARGLDAAISVWTLGADGTSHYTFTGPGNLSATNDPTLNLIRGQKYVFENRSGGHPFRIQSTINGSSGTAYNTGVTNNDGGNGTDILFNVPYDAPAVLYYQCTAHANMGGAMYISGSGYETKIGTGITFGSAGVTTFSG